VSLPRSDRRSLQPPDGPGIGPGIGSGIARRSQSPVSGSARKIIKIFFVKIGIFLKPKNDHQSDHKYHAIHHKLTTKKPPLYTAFSKTTLKNTGKSGVFPHAATAINFLKN
jgi:hypothetical protein